ncbi:Outer membrane protein beta-barrel domain-containing protein [Fodinibius salinus]|uniref:Outer membrane protein beta-barrel domain-containing protein n=1 Tax=Fodinibius salinus TaxID=860790 RepID=A0A5D3YQ57_9BACT|nr:outer membrane beta-barrel protein [Fodinibius salinus]TYP95179.1 Outer membrane protein beta-barrel domain-containing protein [Fodinibius salinus]
MSEENYNDPLKQLFQQKAGDYNISYREEDWNALADRLDAADRKRAARKKRWLAAAVALIVFSTLGYFTYQNYKQNNSLNEQLDQSEEITESPTELPIDDGPTSDKKENSNTTTSDNDTPQLELENDQPSNSSQNLTTADKPENSSKTKSEESAIANSSGLFQTSTDRLTVSQFKCKNCDLAKLDTLHSVNQATISPVSSSSETVLLASNAAGNHFTSTQAVSAQSEIPKASISLVLGPDLSTVGSTSNFHGLGSKFGITASYNINKKFAISIGAIRSNVRYKTNSRQYSFGSQNYGSSNIRASQTTAQCILIDIPLKVTYRFMNFDDSRLFASAGISSYIMLNEKYQFTYQSNQTGYSQQWQGNTGTAHLFSNASLSVGYELDISRNFSLRAEPFLNIPLKEVGRANVNLYSVGSLISLNYHFY